MHEQFSLVRWINCQNENKFKCKRYYCYFGSWPNRCAVLFYITMASSKEWKKTLNSLWFRHFSFSLFVVARNPKKYHDDWCNISRAKRTKQINSFFFSCTIFQRLVRIPFQFSIMRQSFWCETFRNIQLSVFTYSLFSIPWPYGVFHVFLHWFAQDSFRSSKFDKY